MAIRSLLLLVLAAIVVVVSSSHDSVVQAKKTTLKCSCTKSAAGFHKVVTKTTKCLAGASYAAKNKCCAKAAASHHSEVCKYHVTPGTKPGAERDCKDPSCTDILNDDACKPRCNKDAGSQCIALSGGWAKTPSCSCNTAADCPVKDDQTWFCRQYSGSGSELPHTYKGNICEINTTVPVYLVQP